MKNVAISRALIVFFGLCVFAAFAFAQTPQGADADRGDSAETLAAVAYENGQWAKAIEHYRVLLRRGVVDAHLFYNLGTAYAQQEDYGRAVWMLLRARRLDPRDADIRHNLSLIAASHAPNLYSQIAVFPAPPIELIFNYLTVNEWAALGGGATIAAALLLAFVFWRGGESRVRSVCRRLAVAAVVMAGVSHIFAGTMYYNREYLRHGVIIGRETEPRAAPSERAPTYAAFEPGTVVRVSQVDESGWVKVVYSGRGEVFVRREQIEFL